MSEFWELYTNDLRKNKEYFIPMYICYLFLKISSGLWYTDDYRNFPKFSDRQVWANIAEEQSDQGLHCLQFPLHLLNALL